MKRLVWFGFLLCSDNVCFTVKCEQCLDLGKSGSFPDGRLKSQFNHSRVSTRPGRPPRMRFDSNRERRGRIAQQPPPNRTNVYRDGM